MLQALLSPTKVLSPPSWRAFSGVFDVYQATFNGAQLVLTQVITDCSYSYTGGRMFKTLLVPTDGSSLSDKSIHAAIELAKLGGGRIIALSVAEPYPFSPLYESASVTETTNYDEQMRKRAQQIVDKVAEVARAANVPCQTEVALSFSPYEEIIKTVKQHDCDIVFMASHGRKGLNKFFLGSETQKVLAHSTIPVLVFR
jgi:nucleotide-binding universal stress UspA family protein